MVRVRAHDEQAIGKPGESDWQAAKSILVQADTLPKQLIDIDRAKGAAKIHTILFVRIRKCCGVVV